jgi:hypothetical protein
MPSNYSYQPPLDLDAATQEFRPPEYDSDDDIEFFPDEALNHINDPESINMIKTLHREYSDTALRGYGSYVEFGMLDQYDADMHGDTTLRNPHTARVFMHFLSATSVSISVFERSQKDHSHFFMDSAASIADQGLWTYKLPLMAIHHQGLLHAMLAISSLHIAKLQNCSLAPALKHYMNSIKRIHKSAGSQRKRHLVTTLAATLLLAFYEVMTADLSKWTWHLSAATYLVQETDFAFMSYLFKTYQAQDESASPLRCDDDLISTIIGRTVSWDTPPDRTNPIDSFDTQKYEIYQDLFWWYARQDVYQSMMSGNPLL